ncbi:uncharacterized protein LACBIDRAFT_334344 [Laccaria bicolor S238N-H82]|uniref:Predicted protein n=1 Tax=Laccaria bicolor (strain S238N-H82 / ATCC MYA-4686) TaxID=486041 RepID=B0DYX1_LACBS|nr:uncharacterized protein LACBIDRAFT_334344 [Laccaria bicolor S238N-H82]EDR00218.1 predicted protein [Laccaria bicolor S238N-H82]|eukprot:XP_001889127.1 predicted protein [Laccaria bicolor S238N-H82]
MHVDQDSTKTRPTRRAGTYPHHNTMTESNSVLLEAALDNSEFFEAPQRATTRRFSWATKYGHYNVHYHLTRKLQNPRALLPSFIRNTLLHTPGLFNSLQPCISEAECSTLPHVFYSCSPFDATAFLQCWIITKGKPWRFGSDNVPQIRDGQPSLCISPFMQEEDPPPSSVKHSSPPSTCEAMVVNHPTIQQPQTNRRSNHPSSPTFFSANHHNFSPPPTRRIIDQTTDDSHVPRSGELPPSATFGATTNHTPNGEQLLALAASRVAGVEPEDKEALATHQPKNGPWLEVKASKRRTKVLIGVLGTIFTIGLVVVLAVYFAVVRKEDNVEGSAGCRVDRRLGLGFCNDLDFGNGSGKIHNGQHEACSTSSGACPSAQLWMRIVKLKIDSMRLHSESAPQSASWGVPWVSSAVVVSCRFRAYVSEYQSRTASQKLHIRRNYNDPEYGLSYSFG